MQLDNGIHIIFTTARAPRSMKQFLLKELQRIGMMVQRIF